MRQTGAALVTGLAGTAAYTAVSAVLRRQGVTGARVRPVKVAGALTGAAAGPDRHRLADGLLHWGYGSWGGVLRLLVERRWRGWQADAAHLVAFWLPWRLLALATRRRTPLRELALDLAKHAVYVAAAGATARALRRRG